jgi:hypothetical protein
MLYHIKRSVVSDNSKERRAYFLGIFWPTGEDTNYQSTRRKNPEDLNLLTSGMMRKYSTESAIETSHLIQKRTMSRKVHLHCNT